MRTIWLIAQREVVQRSRGKVYRVSTIGIAALLALAVALPSLLGDEGEETGETGETTRTLAVVGEPAEARADALALAFGPTLEIETVADEAAASSAVESGEAAAALVGDRIVAPEGSLFSEASAFARTVAEVLGRADALAAAGLGGQDLADALVPTPLEVVTTGDAEQRDLDSRALVAYFAITFLYATFVMYGQWMANGVIEEKSSRVVEVLLGVVRPRQLLAGKLLGLGLLGLGQLVVFLAPAAAIGASLDSQFVPDGVGGLIAFVALWWGLGYAFYATVMGSLGATASRPEDAQAVAAPATIVLVAAFFVSFLALQDPTGSVAVVASLVPFTAPLVMVIRFAIGDVAPWEIAVAVLLLLASIRLMVGVAGRIYENGLLRTGSRLKLREAWRATS